MATKKTEKKIEDAELVVSAQDTIEVESEIKVKKTASAQKEKAKPATKTNDNTLQSVSRDKGVIIIGAGMLVMGVLLLGGNLLNISFGNYLWPFIFIIPGALVFFSAISANRTNGEGLAIVGGLFSMLGLVFLMQTITGLWATWAYIWALIAPTSIGLSQMFYGNIKNDDAISQTGWNLAKIGLSILAVGFVFFELIIGLSGFGLGRFGLPVFPMILIFVGGFLLLRSILKSR